MKAGIPFLDEMPAVSGDDLRFALGAGQAAGAMKTPGLNPQQLKFRDASEGETYSFTDNPLNRTMYGIRNAFTLAAMRI